MKLFGKVVVVVGASGALLHASSRVEAFVYDVGPNIVNMSGSSCRAATATEELEVQRAAGELTIRAAGAAIPPVSLFCPLNRRNLVFYSRYQTLPAPVSPDTKVDMPGDAQVWLRDAGAGALSCSIFAYNKQTGSIHSGSTKYACSTGGGCNAAPGVDYTGSTHLLLPMPNFSTIPTVNYGYRCSVPRGSKIYYAQASFNPNN